MMHMIRIERWEFVIEISGFDIFYQIGYNKAVENKPEQILLVKLLEVSKMRK